MYKTHFVFTLSQASFVTLSIVGAANAAVVSFTKTTLP